MAKTNQLALRSHVNVEDMPAMVFLEYLEFLTRFPLLRLPAELRQPILKHLFINSILVAGDQLGTAKSLETRSPLRLFVRGTKPKLTRAILQTCCQLREEGTSILYQGVVLELHSLSGNRLTILSLGRPTMHLITKLYLPVQKFKDFKAWRIRNFFRDLKLLVLECDVYDEGYFCGDGIPSKKWFEEFLGEKKGKWTQILRAIDFDQGYKIFLRLTNLPGPGLDYNSFYASDTDDDENYDHNTAELSGPREYKRFFDWEYEEPWIWGAHLS